MTRTIDTLQAPSCIKATSMDALAIRGPNYIGSQAGWYVTGASDALGAGSNPIYQPAPTGSKDMLLYKNLTPLFTGLNTLIQDPVDTAQHILGSTQTQEGILGDALVPAPYESVPPTSLLPGILFGAPGQGSGGGGTSLCFIGRCQEWDQLIGSGSANANQMSWAWWMRKDGDGANTTGIQDHEAFYPRIFSFGSSTRLSSGTPTQGDNFFTTVDDDGYLSLYANTWTTQSGSWVVCNPDGTSTIERHKWYHVVMTYDASSISNDPVFYVDGVQQFVATRTRPTGSYNGISTPFNQATIGCSVTASSAGGGGYGGGICLWSGMFADMAAWNTILTSAEASAVYNGGTPTNLKQLLPEDIVAWYRFTPGAGDTATENRLYGLDPMAGTLVGKAYNRAGPTQFSQSIGLFATTGHTSPLGPRYGKMFKTCFPVSASVFPSLNKAPDLVTFKEDYAACFNTLNLGRNGPYGHPTWKQTRTGDHKVARQLRKENKIGVLMPPAPAKSRRGLQYGKKANKFVDYTEMPVVYDTAKPIEFVFEDRIGGNKDNDLRLKVSYQNNLDYFSNQGLNNRLALGERIRPDVGNAFNAAADYLFDSNLSAVVKYGQKIYPAAENTGQKRIRTREAYNFDDVWNEVRKYRSIQIPPKPNSQGFYDPGESVWPLDAPMSLTHSPDSPDLDSLYPPGGLRGLVVQGGGVMPGGTTAQSTYPAGYLGSQAGELMNTYARFGGLSNRGPTAVTASLAYTMPVPNGQLFSSSISPPQGGGLLFGHVAWTAHESASMPYKPYEGYMESVRSLGKNMSIIPEFRISEHLERYFEFDGGNFLADVDNLFSVTGSALVGSANEDFYKVYSTSDFMKYFKVVDKQLANKTTAAGAQLKRYSIELSCDALMQFLPYKGFYPAERTIELGRLMSQSLGPIRSFPSTLGATNNDALKATKRILLEPLMAPGILFNTIKTGIACSSMVLVGQAPYHRVTGSNNISTTASWFNSPVGGQAGYFESNLDGTGYLHYGGAHGLADAGTPANQYPFYSLRVVSSGSKDLYNTDFYGQTIPFEAIRDPASYLSMRAINGSKRVWNETFYLYDTGLHSASIDPGTNTPAILYNGDYSSPLYQLGIDNFLCETVNFFQEPLKSFLSKPEEEFLAVKKDKYYGMRVKLARTNSSASVSEFPFERSFGMYSRDSAFGPSVLLRGTRRGGPLAAVGDYELPSYEPWLPPHWYGSCEANIIFKAPYSGKVTLTEILGNQITEFEKDSADIVPTGKTGRVPGTTNPEQFLFRNYADGMDVVRPQITSSVNLLQKLLVVPPDTNDQQARWLIQPKFETPVLNFFDVPVSASALYGSFVGAHYHGILNYSSPFSNDGFYNKKNPKIRGMWHQYGKALSGSEGIHLSVENLPTQYSSSTYGGNIDIAPLADIVGMPVSAKRIGNFAEEKTVEEAIICVPFLTVRGNRKFFNVEKRSKEYVSQLALLNKYMFPPTMDFLKNNSVAPFAFYAFEFNMQFTQKDLMDIWQNCAPTKGSAFQKSNVTIKIRSLVDKMLENKEELQWMVFKVKRKAEKDYSVYTKKGLTEGLPIVQESLDSPYSYNWPYDYFSFVELVKIDESVTYATDDIIPEDEEEDVIMPDLREFIPAPKKLSPAIAPPAQILKEVKEGIPTKVIKPKTEK